jgi:hypothetical protein
LRLTPSWWNVRSRRYWLVVAAAAPAGLLLGALLTTQFAQPPHDPVPKTAAVTRASQTPRAAPSASPSAGSADIQARNTAFVQAVYQDLIGAPPSQDALDGWLRALAGGTSRVQVAAAILVSPEYGAAFEDTTFRRLLGRPAGSADWTALLQNGAAPEQLASGVLGSDEYYQRSGGSDRTWVAALYRELLGRDPAPEELDNQLATLARGAARNDIAYALTQTEEYRRRFIRDLFRQYLGRAPGDDELRWLLGAMAAGQSSSAVRAALLGSDEYLRRHAPA